MRTQKIKNKTTIVVKNVIESEGTNVLKRHPSSYFVQLFYILSCWADKKEETVIKCFG